MENSKDLVWVLKRDSHEVPSVFGAICVDSHGLLLTAVTAKPHPKLKARCFGKPFRNAVLVKSYLSQGLATYQICNAENEQFLALDLKLVNDDVVPLLGGLFSFLHTGGNFSFRRGIVNFPRPRQNLVSLLDFPDLSPDLPLLQASGLGLSTNTGMTGCPVFHMDTTQFLGLILFCVDQFTFVLPLSFIRSVVHDSKKRSSQDNDDQGRGARRGGGPREGARKGGRPVGGGGWRIAQCEDEMASFGLEEFAAKYGSLEPSQFVDIVALTDDISNNVPGVTGVGEVHGVWLITEYGSLENLLSNVDKVQEDHIGEALKANQHLAQVENCIREAALNWNADGCFVFTSSSAPYDCTENGYCDEDTHVVPLGLSPKTDALLKAENGVFEHGGCVLRLVGLYKTDRGPHSYWLNQGTSELRPDHIVNLIHYEDAAPLAMSILRKNLLGRVFLGCDSHPLSRQEIMNQVNKSGKFNKKFEALTGMDGVLGKRLNYSKTRNATHRTSSLHHAI